MIRLAETHLPFHLVSLPLVLHGLWSVPRMQGSAFSLPGWFIRLVFAACHREGWGNVSIETKNRLSYSCFKCWVLWFYNTAYCFCRHLQPSPGIGDKHEYDVISAALGVSHQAFHFWSRILCLPLASMWGNCKIPFLLLRDNNFSLSDAQSPRRAVSYILCIYLIIYDKTSPILVTPLCLNVETEGFMYFVLV